MLSEMINDDNSLLELFNYLCEKSKNKGGYNIYRLVEQIDCYRDNLMTHDVSEVVLKLNKITSNFSSYLKDLNCIKPIGKAFDCLNLSDNNDISIVEINRKLLDFYYESDKKQLVTFMKIIDNNKKGYIKYEDFYQKMNKYILDYEHSLVLHLKFINNKIKKEFNGNYNLYVENKKLRSEILKEGEFYEKFKDDFFKDVVLAKRFADHLKQKEGKNSGSIYLQNFIDLLSISNSAYVSPFQEFDSNNDKEFLPLVHKIESAIPLKILFEFIEPKSITQYGKISYQKLIEILKIKFNISEKDRKNFLNKFSTLNLLYDIFELASFLQNYSLKSIEELDNITSKMRTVILKSNTLVIETFFNKFNVNQFKPCKISEILVILPSIFKISIYETLLVFLDIVNNPMNILNNMCISLDLIFQLYGFYELFPSAIKKNIIKIDSYLKQTLKKLYDCLSVEEDISIKFKKYDLDNDSVLTREELMNLLDSFDKDWKFSDSQKIMVIKLADSNNDNAINFPEFIKFMNILKSDFAEIDKINNINTTNKHPNNINKLKTNNVANKELNENNTPNLSVLIKKNELIFEKKANFEINAKTIIDNFTYNSENLINFENDLAYLFLYKIQKKMIRDENLGLKIIEELNKKDDFGTRIVPFSNLIEIIEQKCKIII